MLLLDDDDALPPVPTEGETLLRAALSQADIEAMDRALLVSARVSWLKVARVVHAAVEARDLHPWNENCLHLHVRRLIELVESGLLEEQGNQRRPRFREVRLRRTEED